MARPLLACDEETAMPHSVLLGLFDVFQDWRTGNWISFIIGVGGLVVATTAVFVNWRQLQLTRAKADEALAIARKGIDIANEAKEDARVLSESQVRINKSLQSANLILHVITIEGITGEDCDHTFGNSHDQNRIVDEENPPYIGLFKMHLRFYNEGSRDAYSIFLSVDDGGESSKVRYLNRRSNPRLKPGELDIYEVMIDPGLLLFTSIDQSNGYFGMMVSIYYNDELGFHRKSYRVFQDGRFAASEATPLRFEEI